MTNDTQNRTRASLSGAEASFLSEIGERGFVVFRLDDARQILGTGPKDHTRQFLERLRKKGWIQGIKKGSYALIPLSSGHEPNPQIHEFVIAMELVSPAAVAYWSALNHHGLTEQLPRTVFVATDHPVRRHQREILGIPYRIVSLRPSCFFGVQKAWAGERLFLITDREKTIVDGLDLPGYVGGVGEIAKALTLRWKQLDEKKLFNYAARMSNATVVKRLGFLLEALGLGNPDALRQTQPLSAGFPLLDPTLPGRGKHNRRWRLRINCEAAL